MRNLKKFLALVLSMMMVLSLVVTASAKSITKDGKEQNLNDIADVSFQTAIDVLNGMDVMKGDANPGSTEPNGTFRPTANITRAEVAALVFRLSTGMTDAGAADHYAGYGNFSDVKADAWYAGYVGYCANAGYIKGYAGENGPFGPTDPVTGYQALAMILRAMGYGVNGEFEGTNWKLNVAQVGTQTTILRTINNTHFGGETLSAPAQRQVVAEIFFQAIQQPCVVYTPAYGYQTTDVISGITTGNKTDNGLTANSSLGLRYFGLLGEDRVIVGNQATGESNTLTGEKWVNGNGYEYTYPGTTFRNDEGVVTYTSKGLSLKLETGINLFGHRITVYYDSTGVKSGSANRVYAYYDRAKEATVYATNGDMKDALGKAIADAKFSVDQWNGAYISERFDRITSGNGYFNAKKFAAPDLEYWGADVTTVKEDNGDYGTGALPYGADDVTDNGDNKENGGFFKIISNDGSNANLVISLAPELARITEHNTTVGNTLRLSGKSDVELDDHYDSTFGENDDGVVRMNSLTSTSIKDLGALVLAQEIKGTNYRTNASKELYKGDSNMYYYQVDKIAQTYTGTVKTYNPNNGTVTLTDGKQLTFTRLPIINEAVVRPRDMDHDSDLYFYNGVQYTFLLDPMEPNRYVTCTQANGYEFLYGVYADSDIGGLGTADMNYAITGVDKDGNIKYVQPFTSIDKARVTGTAYELLTVAKKNLGGASNTVGNEIKNGYYTGYGYNAETKDLDAAVAGLQAENWLGGENAPATENNGYATDYWDGKLASNYDYKDDADENGWVDGKWTITKQDVADGWSEQATPYMHGSEKDSDKGRLLLTPKTKFIIVDGLGVSGSSNPVTVDIRNGIGDLLRDASWATIDVNRYIRDENGVIVGQNADYNVYFWIDDEQFNNYYKDSYGVEYSDDNYVVTTVILPKAAFDTNSSNNLWFTNKAQATGQYLADTHADTGTIAEYRVWLNGEPQKIFVDYARSYNDRGDVMDDVNDFVKDTKIGMFFELTQVDTKNGTPIYSAKAMNNTTGVLDNIYASNNPNTICNVGLKYDYTAVNNLNTARLTQISDTYLNSGAGASGRSDVYNVTGATVVNLAGSQNINNIETLNKAVSIGYNVTVAIVNNGHSVSLIYVTDIDDSAVVK